jgi:hypothetical protein
MRDDDFLSVLQPDEKNRRLATRAADRMNALFLIFTFLI